MKQKKKKFNRSTVNCLKSNFNTGSNQQKRMSLFYSTWFRKYLFYSQLYIKYKIASRIHLPPHYDRPHRKVDKYWSSSNMHRQIRNKLLFSHSLITGEKNKKLSVNLFCVQKKIFGRERSTQRKRLSVETWTGNRVVKTFQPLGNWNSSNLTDTSGAQGRTNANTPWRTKAMRIADTEQILRFQGGRRVTESPG